MLTSLHYSSSTLQQNRRKQTAVKGGAVRRGAPGEGSESDARYVSASRTADLARPSNPGFKAPLTALQHNQRRC